MMDYPYIEVVYELRPQIDSVAIDLRYWFVQIVTTDGSIARYQTGDYRLDIATARKDGRIVSRLQEHESVDRYEALLNVHPEER